MWICPKCSEPHEDHFKICWKCASEEMAEHVTAEAPPPPAPEPRLRSGGSILVRVAIAFVVGTILGGAAYQGFARRSLQGEDAAIGVGFFALACGLGLAIGVGVFFWVIFPFEPPPAPQPQEEKNPQGDSPT